MPISEEAVMVDNEVAPSRTEPGRGLRPAHRPPQAIEAILRQSRDALDVAATLTAHPELAPPRSVPDLRAADAAARMAERWVAERLDQLIAANHDPAREQLRAVLAQLGSIRAAIREARLHARSRALTNLHRSLGRLRVATSVAELAEWVPIEINRLGYNRALFSRLRGSQWRARGAFAYADPSLAEALIEIGNAVPGQLGRELPETEVVRGRTAVLVDDAQHNPHVHHRLINLANTKDYVVAPLIGRGSVIGLLHADQQVETDRVDEYDRELLGLFAEGLGCVFERVTYYEQLAALRDRLREDARSVGDLIDGFLDGDALSPARSPAGAGLVPVAGPLAELTRRECDVLRHLAEGQTNTQIAATLYVSPGTVKTHVKNLLRKLGAANRAEAVARYHALTRREPSP
ncbi:MAG TPA: LuxR C-terminal-related transcriptional regulator [Pseudonocardiaceae bacterium]|nr:LuxR C-terminal-related transcriptional regulator [Pseudonocardiaceae bacterium]